MSMEIEKPDSLPKGWVLCNIGELGEINPKLNTGDYPDDLIVTFLPMKCVSELSGHIDLSLLKQLSEVRKGYTAFREGDLLFAKITPCMENGKIAIAQGLNNGIGFGSTEFHVIRFHESPLKKIFLPFPESRGREEGCAEEYDWFRWATESSSTLYEQNFGSSSATPRTASHREQDRRAFHQAGCGS